MRNLKVDQLNLNDTSIINRLRAVIQQLLNNPASYYSLKFKPQYYFEIPNGLLPSEKGWYIILNDRIPIYVGETDNLNARLNTNNRSVDNFANNGRPSDNKRNFIKKFDELNILHGLRVCIIQQKEFCSELGLNTNNLTELDIGNIEKLINIFRCHFNYR